MFDPLNDETTPRDYTSLVEGKEVKSLNKGSSNKNYVFNNCSVTINEEGKAIDILQEQEKQKAKMQEAQMKMVDGIIAIASTTISSMMEARNKRTADMSGNFGEPVMKDPKTPSTKKASAKKKAPVKKVKTKVDKKK